MSLFKILLDGFIKPDSMFGLFIWIKNKNRKEKIDPQTMINYTYIPFLYFGYTYAPIVSVRVIDVLFHKW